MNKPLPDVLAGVHAEMAGSPVAVCAIDMTGATLAPGAAVSLPAEHAGWFHVSLPVGLVALEATTWAVVVAHWENRPHVRFVRPGESFLQRLHHYLESHG